MDINWSVSRRPGDTQVCVRLEPQPIRKGLTKAEIVRILRDGNGGNGIIFNELRELAARIEADGIIE